MFTRCLTLGDPCNPVTLVVDEATRSVALAYGDGSARVVVYPSARDVANAIGALQELAWALQPNANASGAYCQTCHYALALCDCPEQPNDAYPRPMGAPSRR